MVAYTYVSKYVCCVCVHVRTCTCDLYIEVAQTQV